MVKSVGIDESVKRYVTCRQCAHRLEYVGNDIKSGMHYDYGGGSDRVYYIICPNDGSEISVREFHG